MEFMMTCVCCLALLVSAQSDILHRIKAEGSNVTLSCINDGIMVWEKGPDERRKSTLLIARYGKITKYRRDLEDRYGVLANQSLVIRNLSPSDSGIYYCNHVLMGILIVTPALTEDDIPHTASPTVTCCSPVNSSYSATGKKMHSSEPQATSPISGVSVVEMVLMFGGVGLAALMFLMATIAAGRVVLHPVWLEGWNAGRATQLSSE